MQTFKKLINALVVESIVISISSFDVRWHLLKQSSHSIISGGQISFHGNSIAPSSRSRSAIVFISENPSSPSMTEPEQN